MQKNYQESLNKIFRILLGKEEFRTFKSNLRTTKFEKSDSAKTISLEISFSIEIKPNIMGIDYHIIKDTLEESIRKLWDENLLEDSFGVLIIRELGLYSAELDERVSPSFHYFSQEVFDTIRDYIKNEFEVSEIYALRELTFDFRTEDLENLTYPSPSSLSFDVSLEVTKIYLDGKDISNLLTYDLIEQLYGACFYEEYFEDGESILSGILYGKLANDFELNQSDRYVNTYIGVTKILGVDMSEPPEDYTTKQDVMEKIFKLVKS